MKEQFVRFVDKDVDGCGTDVTAIAKVYGNDITAGTIDRVKDAICNYKSANEYEYDTDGCLEAAQNQFETEGYKVDWINEDVEIQF